MTVRLFRIENQDVDNSALFNFRRQNASEGYKFAIWSFHRRVSITLFSHPRMEKCNTYKLSPGTCIFYTSEVLERFRITILARIFVFPLRSVMDTYTWVQFLHSPESPAPNIAASIPVIETKVSCYTYGLKCYALWVNFRYRVPKR